MKKKSSPKTREKIIESCDNCGSLNPIENFGGVWSYLDAREDIERLGTLPKEKQKEIASKHYFGSPRAYLEFLQSQLIDLDEVNEALSQL